MNTKPITNQSLLVMVIEQKNKIKMTAFYGNRKQVFQKLFFNCKNKEL